MIMINNVMLFDYRNHILGLATKVKTPNKIFKKKFIRETKI